MQLNSFETSGSSPTQFYNYIYLREDGTPRYVGKGCNGRAWESRKGHRPPKNPELILIQHFESEEDAFFAEKFLISLYGRKDLGTGCLRNLTDGGENPPSRKGTKHSPEQLEKFSKAMKGRTLSPEHKAKISLANLGKKRSPEINTRMNDARKGRTLSAEHKANISAGMKGKNLGKTASAETIARMRATRIGVKQSPELIRKRVESRRGYKHSPETRAKISASKLQRRSNKER